MKLSKLQQLSLVSLSLALTACGSSSRTGVSSQNLIAELSEDNSAIVGGVNVQPGESIINSIVAIYDRGSGGLCTGSLLSNNIVLTAAHCIGAKASDMVVIFDTKLSSNSLKTQVDMAIVHADWRTNQNKEQNTGDIALVHFKGLAPANYQAAELLSDARSLKNGGIVELAGFGITESPSGSGSGTLRKVNAKISDIRFSATEVELDQRSGRGACHGDSGGPAYKVVRGKKLLWGITSRGSRDSNDTCKQFSVYTNALTYKSWIERSSAQLLKASIVAQKN